MPDHTCPHLSPVGDWCRLKTNFKCPASAGRNGCPFPRIPDLNRRASERLELVDISLRTAPNPPQSMQLETQFSVRARAFDELVKPFTMAEIEWQVVGLSRDQRRAFLKPTVSTRSVIDRLDHAVGASHWSERYTTLPSGQISCRLTIMGIDKEAVSVRSEHVSENRSESLRAAATKFGVGRSLERVAPVWVDWDAQTELPLETPVLPAWAIAEVALTPSRSLEPRSSEPRNTQRVSSAPTRAPSVAISEQHRQRGEQRNQEQLIQEMIRAVRELPGGESALRRILRRYNRAAAPGQPTDRRGLYADLRRTYRELSGQVLEAA
jgi:hypothetical protein